MTTKAIGSATAALAKANDAKGAKDAKDAKDAKGAKKARELEKAAREFEAIFVKSMLEQSGALGGKKDGYGDMAVSALAGAVTQGRGLGLAETIRRAIDAQGSTNERGDR